MPAVAVPARAAPGPCSSGRSMNAVARPASRAAARSASCAAASMTSPGSSSRNAAGRRYASLSGLYARDTSEPRMRSHGSPAAFAMSSSSDVFPLDIGPTMYPLCLIAAIPATLSGHGGRKCQARARACSSRGSKAPGSRPSARSASSRFSLCSTSRDTNGRAPERTRCIAGWYWPRHESANACGSSSSPCLPANERTAAAIPERQSTTVPNTSNSTARTVRPVEGARYATRPASHPRGYSWLPWPALLHRHRFRRVHVPPPGMTPGRPGAPQYAAVWSSASRI